MRIKSPKSEKFKKNLAYRGPKKWNALPVCLQTVMSKGEFKGKVKAYLLGRIKTKAAKEVEGEG